MFFSRQESQRSNTYRLSRNNLTSGSTKSSCTTGTFLSSGLDGSFRTTNPTMHQELTKREDQRTMKGISCLPSNKELGRVLESMDSVDGMITLESHSNKKKKHSQLIVRMNIFGYFGRRDKKKKAVDFNPSSIPKTSQNRFIALTSLRRDKNLVNGTNAQHYVDTSGLTSNDQQETADSASKLSSSSNSTDNQCYITSGIDTKKETVISKEPVCRPPFETWKSEVGSEPSTPKTLTTAQSFISSEALLVHQVMKRKEGYGSLESSGSATLVSEPICSRAISLSSLSVSSDQPEFWEKMVTIIPNGTPVDSPAKHCQSTMDKNTIMNVNRCEQECCNAFAVASPNHDNWMTEHLGSVIEGNGTPYPSKPRSISFEEVAPPPLVSFSSLTLKKPQRKCSLSSSSCAETPPILHDFVSMESLDSHWSMQSIPPEHACSMPSSHNCPLSQIPYENEITLPKLCTPTSGIDSSRIEICPGQYETIRSAEETMMYMTASNTDINTLDNSSLIVTSCCRACHIDNYHVCDAAYVICAACRIVFPYNTNDGFGIGLGFFQ